MGLLARALNGNDTITGSTNADKIYGFAGDDIIDGGNDKLTDNLVGGSGNN